MIKQEYPVKRTVQMQDATIQTDLCQPSLGLRRSHDTSGFFPQHILDDGGSISSFSNYFLPSSTEPLSLPKEPLTLPDLEMDGLKGEEKLEALLKAEGPEALEQLRLGFLNGGARPEGGGEAGGAARRGLLAAGCQGCSSGRLVRCAHIKCAPVHCWGTSSTAASSCFLGVVWTAFFISLLGTIVFCFTDLFNNTILANMVLTENSTAFQIWKDPPVKPIMKIHIFNYTNTAEVMDGRESKFRVQDVGPYVYRETLKHVNIVFHPNSTMTYQDQTSFEFIPSLSSGTQFDKIIVPNIPMLSALAMASNSYYMSRLALSTLFKSLKTKPFLELPVDRFLWGYEDDLVSLARPLLKLSSDIPFTEKFGVLASTNGTRQDRITIFTGEQDLNKIGVIERINGQDHLPHWATEECNRVNASEGSMFPPSTLDGKQTIYIFNKELCRRLPFHFTKEVEVMDGVKALRYSVPDDVFDRPETNPLNQCYCHIDSGTCPPRGVFNSSPCAFGAPVYASFPHFYLGDPELTESIEGLEPSPDKHCMYLDIHPTLGFPLRAINRIQINMMVKKGDGISGVEFLEENLILPIMWLDVSVKELPQSLRRLVYHGTFSAEAARLGLTWGSVTMLLASSTVLLGLLWRRRRCSRKI